MCYTAHTKHYLWHSTYVLCQHTGVCACVHSCMCVCVCVCCTYMWPFLSSRHWLAVETSCVQTSVPWSKAAWRTSMVCMTLQECGNLDLSGWLHTYLLHRWLADCTTNAYLCLQSNAFKQEWQCYGETSTAGASRDSLCCPSSVLQGVEKGGAHSHKTSLHPPSGRRVFPWWVVYYICVGYIMHYCMVHLWYKMP